MTRLVLILATLIAIGNGAPASAQASWQSLPVIPRIDGPLRRHLIAVLRVGRARGNSIDVFAKVGDSMTESASFLADIGCGGANLGSHADLASTIAFFSRHTFPASYTAAWCGVANSFTRASATAVTGWDAGQALAPLDRPPALCGAPFDRPLACELHVLRPAIALVMYGTNDLERTSVRVFSARLRAIVGQTLAAGTMPVLSTIPPRHDRPEFAARVGGFNAAIASVARDEVVPLWNFWAALTQPSLIDQGISRDGIHPSVLSGDQGATLNGSGLRYGYNVRNLTALQILQVLRRSVIAVSG